MKSLSTKLVSFFWNHKKRSSVFIVFVSILLFILWPKPHTQIQTEKVKRMDIKQTIGVNGTVFAKTSVNLTFPIAGKVVYLAIKKGDTVVANQTIATLDQRTVQKNLEQTLLDYSKQRNNFDQIQANNQSQKPSDAVNDTIKRILQNNQYDLDKSVKSVELQDLAKQQSILTTPISGIVTRADVKTTGVNIGVGAIFTVTDPSIMVFDMDVDEADIGKITTNQSVDITLDPYPDTLIHAAVDNIDFVTHTTTTGSTAYTVEVKLPANSHMKYRDGMNGNADIILQEKQDMLSIPISSVLNGKSVYIKTSQGFEKRNISTGLQNDTDTEITYGLAEGDIVATQPTDMTIETKNTSFFQKIFKTK